MTTVACSTKNPALIKISYTAKTTFAAYSIKHKINIDLKPLNNLIR